MTFYANHSLDRICMPSNHSDTLATIYFPDSWNPSHFPGRVFNSHSFRLLIHYSKSWCCFKLFMLIPMRKVDIWFGIHYRNPAEHERYLQYIRRNPKLYIPSTINIFKGAHQSHLGRWKDGLVSGRLACNWV